MCQLPEGSTPSLCNMPVRNMNMILGANVVPFEDGGATSWTLVIISCEACGGSNPPTGTNGQRFARNSFLSYLYDTRQRTAL